LCFCDDGVDTGHSRDGAGHDVTVDSVNGVCSSLIEVMQANGVIIIT
jgi:phosphopentomutase